MIEINVRIMGPHGKELHFVVDNMEVAVETTADLFTLIQATIKLANARTEVKNLVRPTARGFFTEIIVTNHNMRPARPGVFAIIKTEEPEEKK